MTEIQDEIIARKFVIVDEKERPRIMMAVEEDGTAIVEFADPDNAHVPCRLRLSVEPGGEATVALWHPRWADSYVWLEAGGDTDPGSESDPDRPMAEIMMQQDRTGLYSAHKTIAPELDDRQWRLEQIELCREEGIDPKLTDAEREAEERKEEIHRAHGRRTAAGDDTRGLSEDEFLSRWGDAAVAS